MNNKIIKIVLTLLILSTSASAWDKIDRVIAVVNDRPIIESVVDRKVEIFKGKKGFRNKPLSVIKSTIIDQFINEEILEETAEVEAIFITDKKINNEVKKIMARMKISKIEDFKRIIEKKEKIPFDEYKSQLRRSILMDQILAYAIVFDPPSREEALEWYKKNRSKLLQMKLKHILIRPRNSSFSEEKRVSKLLAKIRKQAVAGKSFEALAKKYSEGPTGPKGGDLGWMAMAEMDPYFAQGVYTLSKYGQVSNPIKSSFGYHIVKYYGRRIAPFEDFQDRIYNMLAQQKRMENFQKWVLQKRNISDIRIYYKDYKSTIRLDKGLLR